MEGLEFLEFCLNAFRSGFTRNRLPNNFHFDKGEWIEAEQHPRVGRHTQRSGRPCPACPRSGEPPGALTSDESGEPGAWATALSPDVSTGDPATERSLSPRTPAPSDLPARSPRPRRHSLLAVPTGQHAAAMAATVTVGPAGRCQWDEAVRIVVRGLAPEQSVTLRASLRDEKGVLFRAHARYLADAGGELDLTRAPALGGSFAGLEPMGLLWALEPEKPFWRFLKRDVQTPFVVELEVLDGHEPDGGRLLGRAVHERGFLAPGVRRERVRAGRVRATLFLPPGPGPFPGIIDLFGVGGGLLEYRASLLAGHGFATLALAYYDFEDLPKEFNSRNMDYFEEAVCYMLQHSQVKGPGIGLLGISLGADICLSMASFLKNISATVSINGSGFSGSTAICYKDACIPPLGLDLRRIKTAFSGLLDIVDVRNDIVGGYENPSMIPIEKAQGPILFIVGQDDHNWRSELYAQIASERLQAHGKKKPQIISYPGTGHYIEPPYFPMCPASLNRLLKKPVIWGGESRAHSKAQVDAWKQILTFFCTHLGDNQKRACPKL